MNMRWGSLRSALALLVASCLLLLAVPALGASPAITGLHAPTHSSQDVFVSNASPQFVWDAASTPSLIGSVDTPGNAHRVAVEGDTVYVADGASGLQVIDISDPSAVTVIGSYDTPAYAEGVAVAGDVAYVVDSDSFFAIDISEPAAPTRLGSYGGTNAPHSVAVSGDVAYVADDGAGLTILDISDPSAPGPLGSIDTSGCAWGVTVAGDVAWVADWTAGLVAIDVSDPSDPRRLGFCDTPGVALDVAISGDMAYVADYNGLQVIDVSDPTAPSLVGSLDPSDDMNPESWGVAVAGDVVWLGDTLAGVHAIDVSEPTSPTLLATYDTPGSARGVAVSGHVAYVADGPSGVQVISASEPTAPEFVGSSDTTGVGEVAVAGDVAYVTGGEDGLYAIDISDPSIPELVGSFDTTGVASDVAVAGDVAYVADDEYGLQAIDISDPSALTYLGSFDTTGEANGVVVDGDVAYVANRGSGLQVIDVSDPRAPAFMGSYDTTGQVWGVAVAGDLACLAVDEYGLHTIDVSEPSAPSLLGSYVSTYTAWAMNVAIAGDIAYVGDYEYGLYAIDISDPSIPELVGSFETTGSPLDVALSGDTAYVADRDSGLQAIDVSNPSAPVLLSRYDTGGLARGVATAGDIAYVADHDYGLQAIDVGSGPVGYSYVLDQDPSTVPDTVIDGVKPTVTLDAATDGAWWFHVRAVGVRREAGAISHRRVLIDTTAPTTTSDGLADYVGGGTIALTADDGAGAGVANTYYKFDDAEAWQVGTSAVLDVPGEHSLNFYSKDKAGNAEAANRVDFTLIADSTDYISLSGSNRYATAIKTSQATFADGTADFVVIATGQNWPDALGGAALAAAKNGPILLTTPGELSAGVIGEIRRLGADRAIILGGTGAVSETVQDALEAELGSADVTRVWGSNRYTTAEAIAAATIEALGSAYDGRAFLSTGKDFPDALAGSPIAAAKGWPIFLSNPDGEPPTAAMARLGVTDVLVLGGEGVISGAQERALESAFRTDHVDRLWGPNRYATAVAVATYGVDTAGLAWDGLALSTGENFPDALAGGVLAGTRGSVMLLTDSTSLPSVDRNKLIAERDWIAHVYYLGGTGAISQGVRDAVAAALH